MKLKRIIAFFAMVAMMATMLAGCGTPADSKTTEAPAVETTGEQTTEEKEFSYPMPGNPTVEIWGSVSSTILKTYSKHEDRPVFQKLMADTGINLKWRYASSQENQDTEFQFMIAGGNYTDIFGCKGIEAQQYYLDGVTIELTDVINQYMPNFKAYLEAHPEVDRVIKSDDGKYYYIPFVNEQITATNGSFIRKDWLDALNAEVPETIDEWHDLLVKVRDTYGVAPICSRDDEILMWGVFAQAYCPDMNMASFYYVEDGKAVYIPATEGFKEFMKLMRDWYAEGLIYPDFISLKMADWRAKMANGEGFLSSGWIGSGLVNIYNTGKGVDPNFEFVAVPTATLKKGEEARYCTGTPIVNAAAGNAKVITTTCKNVEAAARYLDYCFSPEGIELLNYGIEGVSYNMVDGIPTYTDIILKNPQGLAVNEAKAPYMDNFAGGTGVLTYHNTKGQYYGTPGAEDAMSIFASKGTIDFTISQLSYTEDETTEMSTYTSEIDKYMKSCRTGFILGTMDIDTQWDEYINKLNSLGLDKVLAVKQAAADRFLAK